MFIMRGYAAKGDSKYFGVSTVQMRDDGMWEPTAWQTSGHAPKGYEVEGIEYLLDMGLRVSGTFETRRLPAFKRMFKRRFDLQPLKEFKKEYNGKLIDFIYVEFIKGLNDGKHSNSNQTINNSG